MNFLETWSNAAISVNEGKTGFKMLDSFSCENKQNQKRLEALHEV